MINYLNAITSGIDKSLKSVDLEQRLKLFNNF